MAYKKVSLAGSIRTNSEGYNSLSEFYSDCKRYHNEQIYIDFSGLYWFDMNLCALFESILFKLSQENHLKFITDLEYLKSRFDIMFRNGFLKSQDILEDERRSSIPAKSFYFKQKDDFVQYLDKDFMEHRGIPSSYQKIKASLIDDLIEVFGNAKQHANTLFPIFICGQFYPTKRKLILTIVDIGEGFLPKIKEVTKMDKTKITSHFAAIQWAIKLGNTSKLKLSGTPGGLGLPNIIKSCHDKEGLVEIVTGDAYWSSSNIGSPFPIYQPVRPFTGTTINLTLMH